MTAANSSIASGEFEDEDNPQHRVKHLLKWKNSLES